MNNALLMGGFERLGDLSGDGQGFINRDGPFGNPVGQLRSLDEFEDQGLRVTGRFQTVNRADIGVIQRRQDFGFALEPSETVRIGGECLRQDLEPHIPVERGVAGLIHLAHPAFADLGGDLVDAEPGAGGQGHGGVLILPLAGRGCNAG